MLKTNEDKVVEPCPNYMFKIVRKPSPIDKYSPAAPR